jgi:uncharacterized protein (UPF0303 family)
MSQMTYNEANELIMKQEEMLRFEHYNNQDAWELGKLIVEEIHKKVSKMTKEDVITHGLSENDYIFCGGGFPVRIKGSGIVAVITVSNMPHVKDHDFIVGCLSKYLRVTEVPELDMDI